MFKDGLATKTDYVTVYNYNDQGEFTGESTILVEEGTGIPAQSTLEKVNKEKRGFARVFDKKWTYVEDHRDTEVYDIDTKQKEEVKYLGVLKPEHTTIAPPSTDHEFIDGSWIITAEKQLEIEAREKQRGREEIEQRIAYLRGEIIYLAIRGKDTSEAIREIEECEGKLEGLLKEM